MLDFNTNSHLDASRWTYPYEESLRIGAELKFPLTTCTGDPVSRRTVEMVWQHMLRCSWKPLIDKGTCALIGATQSQHEGRHTASCETGYCKIEFALAPVANLFDLEKSIASVRDVMRSFSEKNDARFLAVGIHPAGEPGSRLMSANSRESVWDRVLVSNNLVQPLNGHDVHLFTLNAGSHVHLNVPDSARIAVLNVLNAFVPAQLALTANSTVWQGELDPRLNCVNEMLWGWWLDDPRRYGVPDRPFENYESYVDYIADLPFLFAVRDEVPILINRKSSLRQFLKLPKCEGTKLDGSTVTIRPNSDDLYTHYRCCWHCNRLTRYHTVENRTNDQQLPGELVVIAALTLGLISALPEALEDISNFNWSDLPELRVEACLKDSERNNSRYLLRAMANRMVALADLGLRRRNRGEEVFLAPLHERLRDYTCPSHNVAHQFAAGGLSALVDFLTI